jgi:predicted nucleic acid-binding protein
VKGLDTPILLKLLRGDPAVRTLLRSLKGEELVTTEWNFLELEALAKIDGSPGRERRRAALDSLRRRLTVLPLDERAVVTASARLGRVRHPKELIGAAVLATLESRGCTELLTSGATLSRSGIRSKVRVNAA